MRYPWPLPVTVWKDETNWSRPLNLCASTIQRKSANLAEIAFLNLRARVEYTVNSERAAEETSGLFLPLRGVKETALRLRLSVAGNKGGLFCLSAHFNRADRRRAKDARLPRAHEDEGGRKVGWRRAAKKGRHRLTPNSAGNPFAHGGFKCAGNLFPREVRLVRRGEFDAVYRAGRKAPFEFPLHSFSSAPTNYRRADSASASRRLWAARVVRNRIRGACARSCAATGWRYPQDGHIVIHPKNSVARAEFAALTSDLLRVLKSM